MREWAVIVHGPSLIGLEKNIRKFKGRFLWAVVNDWERVQKHILDKINERVDLVYAVCSTRRKNMADPPCTCITDDDDNYEINSLCGCLNLLSTLGAERIHVFGADGRAREYDTFRQTYWREDTFPFDLKAEQPHKKYRAILKDTNQINKEYKPKTKVINVCPDSAIEVFEKKTYEDVMNE